MPELRSRRFAALVAEHKNTKISDLPTDMQVLFGFLALVVDIKYRHRYGSSLLEATTRGRMDGLK